MYRWIEHAENIEVDGNSNPFNEKEWMIKGQKVTKSKKKKGRKLWRVMINQILKGHGTLYIAYRLHTHTQR